VSALEVALVLAGGPILLYGLVVLLVVGPRLARKPRYRAGGSWPYEPLWWTANPAGAALPPADDRPATGERGGARGSW
jgi:hypothetical protein